MDRYTLSQRRDTDEPFAPPVRTDDDDPWLALMILFMLIAVGVMTC